MIENLIWNKSYALTSSDGICHYFIRNLEKLMATNDETGYRLDIPFSILYAPCHKLVGQKMPAKKRTINMRCTARWISAQRPPRWSTPTVLPFFYSKTVGAEAKHGLVISVSNKEHDSISRQPKRKQKIAKQWTGPIVCAKMQCAWNEILQRIKCFNLT